MNVAGYIFAGLAAAVHVYIFVLESILWTAPEDPRHVRREVRGRGDRHAAARLQPGLLQPFSWRSCRRSAS